MKKNKWMILSFLSLAPLVIAPFVVYTIENNWQSAVETKNNSPTQNKIVNSVVNNSPELCSIKQDAGILHEGFWLFAGTGEWQGVNNLAVFKKDPGGAYHYAVFVNYMSFSYDINTTIPYMNMPKASEDKTAIDWIDEGVISNLKVTIPSEESLGVMGVYGGSGVWQWGWSEDQHSFNNGSTTWPVINEYYYPNQITAASTFYLSHLARNMTNKIETTSLWSDLHFHFIPNSEGMGYLEPWMPNGIQWRGSIDGDSWQSAPSWPTDRTNGVADFDRNYGTNNSYQDAWLNLSLPSLSYKEFNTSLLMTLDTDESKQYVEGDSKMYGHFRVKMNDDYIGALLMNWSVWRNQLTSSDSNNNWVTPDPTSTLASWWNKLKTDDTQNNYGGAKFNDLNSAMVGGLLSDGTSIVGGSLIAYTNAESSKLGNVINWQIPFTGTSGDTPARFVNQYTPDAYYCVENWLQANGSAGIPHWQEPLSAFEADLKQLTSMKWKTDADTKINDSNTWVPQSSSNGTLQYADFPQIIINMLSENFHWNIPYVGSNQQLPSESVTGTLSFTLPELCANSSVLECQHINADINGEDNITYTLQKNDSDNGHGLGRWIPSSSHDNFGIWGTAANASTPTTYLLDDAADGTPLHPFTAKVAFFNQIDAIQIASYDPNDPNKCFEPIQANSKPLNGAGSWSDELWNAFLSFLYSQTPDTISKALVTGEINTNITGIQTVSGFNYRCFMWTKPGSGFTDIDQLVDPSSIIWSGNIHTGALHVNFNTQDGHNYDRDDITFQKKFDIWSTSKYAKPPMDPSQVTVDILEQQLIQYNQPENSLNDDQDYIFQTNATYAEFMQACGNITLTPHDGDGTLDVHFGSKWDTVPTYKGEHTPTYPAQHDFDISSNDFNPAVELDMSFTDPTYKTLSRKNEVVMITCKVENEGSYLFKWHYQYNNTEGQLPDGVTVKTDDPQIQDNWTIYIIKFTATRDLTDEIGQNFKVWGTCADKGSLEQALEIDIVSEPQPTPNKKSYTGAIVGGILGGILVIGLGVGTGLWVKKHRKPSPKKNKSLEKVRDSQFDE